MDPRNWEIGPYVGGVNKSVGVDPTPWPRESGGWFIDLPQAGGKIGYVTMLTGSLAGKTMVRMRFRVEAAPSVELQPMCCPALPSIFTLYFQRAGDDWFATSRTETYRWWATFASVMPVQLGRDCEIVARFDQNWTAILTSHAYAGALVNPKFQDALRNATRVGFTFGGGDGYGHGVYATGSARFVLLEFRIE